MSVGKRWKVAKQLKLCYHCLAKGHMGQICFRSRVCGLNDCKGKQHRLLNVTQCLSQEITVINLLNQMPRHPRQC